MLTVWTGALAENMTQKKKRNVPGKREVGSSKPDKRNGKQSAARWEATGNTGGFRQTSNASSFPAHLKKSSQKHALLKDLHSDPAPSVCPLTTAISSVLI